MKKYVIILVVIILLSIIAFNIGKMFGRKVFEGDEAFLVDKTEDITQTNVTSTEQEITT